MKRKAGRMPVASKESQRGDGVFGDRKHKLANLKTNLILSPPDSELSHLIYNGSEPITGLVRIIRGNENRESRGHIGSGRTVF